MVDERHGLQGREGFPELEELHKREAGYIGNPRTLGGWGERVGVYFNRSSLTSEFPPHVSALVTSFVHVSQRLTQFSAQRKLFWKTLLGRRMG